MHVLACSCVLAYVYRYESFSVVFPFIIDAVFKDSNPWGCEIGHIELEPVQLFSSVNRDIRTDYDFYTALGSFASEVCNRFIFIL